jgi:hypothetical protein
LIPKNAILKDVIPKSEMTVIVPIRLMRRESLLNNKCDYWPLEEVEEIWGEVSQNGWRNPDRPMQSALSRR